MTLRETLERVRSMTLPANEETAKIQIILPVLDALGWDTRDPGQVKYEYSVGAGGQTSRGGGGKADIALVSRQDRPVALIEAKSPGQDLSRHVTQMLGYAFHEGVTICVLTNGPHWWLYLPREAGQPMERRFADLQLVEDPLDQVVSSLEAFLSRKALVGGSAERRARKVLEELIHFGQLERELPRVWNEMLGEPGGGQPDDELLTLVINRVHAKTRLRATPEQVTAVLRGRSVPPTPTEEAKPSAMSEQDVRAARAASPTDTPKKRKRPSVKPTGFVLWGREHPAGSYHDLLVGVAQAIHDRHPHDFQRIGELRGRKLPHASRNPDELFTSKRVGTTGWHVNVHLSGQDTIRRARQFLAHFGYNADELKVLYDSDAPTPPEPSQPRQRTVRRARRVTTARTPQPGKPTGFELWGQHYTVDSFNDIPVGVAQAIHDRRPRDFHRIGELQGRKWPYASRNPDELHQAKQVGTTGWHIDVHFSGPNAIRRAWQFLEHFGHDPDDLKLLYD